MLIETQEPGFRVVEGLLVVHGDVILSSIVGAHSDPLQGQRSGLLDHPDLQDPVLVQGVDTERVLVTN
jgi:hypothetical protein